MKTIFQISLFLLCGSLLLQSCTKVSDPYYTVKSVIVDTTKRSVLIEDYTGHRCPNCPPAGKMANSLQEIYHGQVYAMAVHAGDFAKPMPNDPDLYPDYRCAAGDAWNTYFNIGAEGYPVGMVNRRLYKTKISFGTSDWNSAIQVAVGLPKIAIMTVKNNYNSQTKLLSSKVDIKFLASYKGKVNLTVCILEDSIYGGQLNNVPPDSMPLIKHFRFMHMLRGAINTNGSVGDEIATNPSANGLVSKTYTGDFNGKIWVPRHCTVIGFISDADTKEVLHVSKSSYINP